MGMSRSPLYLLPRLVRRRKIPWLPTGAKQRKAPYDKAFKGGRPHLIFARQRHNNAVGYKLQVPSRGVRSGGVHYISFLLGLVLLYLNL